MINRVIDKLKEFGYDPHKKEFETYYDVKFLSFGSDNFKNYQLESIRNICRDKLMEFYYGANTQHIYIRKDMRKEKLKEIDGKI
jgi:hypothetical protein